MTPDLCIRRASAAEHEDLFWALKGSLGAFSIVTTIKMKTVKNTGIFAGAISFKEKYLPLALGIIDDMAHDTDEDPHTLAYLSWAYLPHAKGWYYAGYVVNTENRSDTTFLLAWNEIPLIHSSLRHTTIADSADELSYGNDVGLRRHKFTFTVEISVEVLLRLHALIQEATSNIEFDQEDLLGVTFQPLPLAMLHHSSFQGAEDNVFAETFSATRGPLVLVSVETWWNDGTRDDEFGSWLRRLEKLLLHAVDAHPWIYPNYAATWQEPLSAEALGKRTIEQLRQVKQTYDPNDIWSEIRHGSWDM